MILQIHLQKIKNQVNFIDQNGNGETDSGGKARWKKYILIIDLKVLISLDYQKKRYFQIFGSVAENAIL